MSNETGANVKMPVLLTLAIVMILAPMGCVLHFFDAGPFWYMQILAMSWLVNIESDNIYFRPDSMMLFATLAFSFMRFVFLYMVWRAYQGKTTQKRVIRVGIAMELCFTLLYYLPLIISILLIPMWSTSLQLAIPFPILLLAGWIVLKLRPPSETFSSWVESEQAEPWWDEGVSSSANQ
ncbi:MAG: hypothetical protein ACXABY_14280 [Candidatus Thorarchaeota archaeon]|jgi:hypothetical protein